MVTKDALEIAQENYKQYGVEVASGRAYPRLQDGCKSVVKRSLYGMYKEGPRSIQKLAKLAAYALPYHPHPSSISGAIIQLGENGNKLKLIDTQGNWGDSSRGIQASAERYIGGKLSDLAIELFCDSVEYCDFMKGEIDEDEPVALPALLPLCFINGVEGIPSGLPRINIPTLDIMEMFDYYIDILKHKDVKYRPTKLPRPNLDVDVLSKKQDWNDLLLSGKGSIRIAPRMDIQGNVITITALPASKSVEHARKIVEKEILLDKIDFTDETAKDLRIVIEKVKNKQCDMNELYTRLYNKLSCNVTYNMAFFDDSHIYVPLGFDKVVQANLEYVIKTHQNRISKQLADLRDKAKVLSIIQDMKDNNLLHNMFNLDESQAKLWLCNNYNVTDSISTMVLRKPISYLTREHTKEITDLNTQIAELVSDSSDIFTFLLKKYTSVKKKVSKVIKTNTVKFV